MSLSWEMLKFSSPRETKAKIKECCCLISSMRIILERVSLKELNRIVVGIVRNRKLFKKINKMKNQ